MNLLKHNITQKVYNNKKINDIIFNQNKRIVSIFKDNVIYNDCTEFFYMFYSKFNSLYYLKHLKTDFNMLLYFKDFINFSINKIMNNHYIKVKQLKKNYKPIRNILKNSISIKKIIESYEKEKNDLSNFLNLDSNINYIQELDNSKNSLVRQISFVSKLSEDILPITDECLTIENKFNDYISIINKKENMKIINICDVFKNTNDKIKNITKKINLIEKKNKKLFIVRKKQNSKLINNRNGSLINANNYLMDKNKKNDEILKNPKRCNTENLEKEKSGKSYKTIPLNIISKKIKTISLLSENDNKQRNINENNFRKGKLNNKILIHTKTSKKYYSNNSISTLDSNLKDNKSLYHSSEIQLIQNNYKSNFENTKNGNVISQKYCSHRGQNSKKKISLIRKKNKNNIQNY